MPNNDPMTMVERVARAIWAKATELVPDGDRVPWEDVNYGFQADILGQARAAIEAMREPTPDMLKGSGGWDEKIHWNEPFPNALGHWRAMIDAALSE